MFVPKNISEQLLGMPLKDFNPQGAAALESLTAHLKDKKWFGWVDWAGPGELTVIGEMHDLDKQIKECPKEWEGHKVFGRWVAPSKETKARWKKQHKWADKLEELLGPRTSHTLSCIIKLLREDNIEEAYLTWRNDGDKFSDAEDWSREVKYFLYKNMGCRVHQLPLCKDRICKAIYRKK